jgi:hypothetical protein
VLSDTAAIHLADLQSDSPELYSVANFWPGKSGFEPDANNIDPSRPSTTVFLHGYNVTEESARRGWFPTVYKRLYWTGSKANFVGVTWEGDEDEFNLWFNLNVANALKGALGIGEFIASLPGPRDVFAHSLGNLVMSEAIMRLPSQTIRTYVCVRRRLPRTPMRQTLLDGP